MYFVKATSCIQQGKIQGKLSQDSHKSQLYYHFLTKPLLALARQTWKKVTAGKGKPENVSFMKGYCHFFKVLKGLSINGGRLLYYCGPKAPVSFHLEGVCGISPS